MSSKANEWAAGSEGTRLRILQAAQREFSDYGLAGARMDRIATEANANKQLIYRYFGSKQALYDAVIEHLALESRASLQANRDAGLSFLDQTDIDARKIHLQDAWARILGWEGLTDASSDAASETARRENYRLMGEWIAADQNEGKIPDVFEARHVEALLTCASLFPFTMPKVFEMITGQSPDEVSAVERWMAFVKNLILSSVPANTDALSPELPASSTRT